MMIGASRAYSGNKTTTTNIRGAPREVAWVLWRLWSFLFSVGSGLATVLLCRSRILDEFFFFSLSYPWICG